MTDGDHHRERPAVQQVEHAPGERLGTTLVVCGRRHLHSLLFTAASAEL